MEAHRSQDARTSLKERTKMADERQAMAQERQAMAQERQCMADEREGMAGERNQWMALLGVGQQQQGTTEGDTQLAELLKLRNAELEAEVAASSTKLAAQEKELQQLHNRNRDLQQGMRGSQGMKQTLQNLQGNVVSLTGQRDLLQRHLEAGQHQIAYLTGQLQAALQRCNFLESQGEGGLAQLAAMHLHEQRRALMVLQQALDSARAAGQPPALLATGTGSTRHVTTNAGCAILLDHTHGMSHAQFADDGQISIFLCWMMFDSG
ncbi:hypothetical protein WJX73_004386 [Symbiochloris irregularis]|uniref:Uncharacterized protein n=1 Tax=Symbiochloris irregularis TaxID=706552 RepID=A0AAW1PFH7_9CHLO